MDIQPKNMKNEGEGEGGCNKETTKKMVHDPEVLESVKMCIGNIQNNGQIIGGSLLQIKAGREEYSTENGSREGDGACLLRM